MAKAAGWYPDPWGSGGRRWWNGSQWTEHEQAAGQPGQAGGPPPASVPPMMPAGGMVSYAPSRPWYEEWWFVGLALFLCCWPVGLILTWTRSNTPTSTKAIVTVAWVVVSLAVGAALVASGLYPMQR